MAASGKRVAALENIPTLLPEATAFWEAYCALSERREWREDGNRRVPEFIRVSEIEAYCRFTERFDQDDQLDFLHYCSVLDREYQNHVKKQKPPAPARQPRGRK